MKKLILTSISYVLVLFLIGCNQDSKTTNNTKIATNDIGSSSEDDFASFQANFKPKELENLKELSEEFNNHYLANDGSLIEVSKTFKEKFLKDLNTENLYYGFITKITNKSLILTFLKHYGAENVIDGEVIDTTFFVSIVYSGSGEYQCSFRTFGSNLSGEPPTYNMRSTFEHENDKLIITNYEYSIGTSYSEAMPLPGSDSIYQADLTMTKYYLNYATNKIVAINKSKSKVKVVESNRNPLPVYLRPVD